MNLVWLTLIAALGSVLSGVEQSIADTTRIDFETFATDESPRGFSTERTGPGDQGRWVVRQDTTASGKVLMQESSDATSGRFPLCVYDGMIARDAVASVRFKPISGRVDQAAGLVWRYRDPNNYYIVRANALEGNVVLYKVEDGKRTDLKPAGAWPLTYGKKAPVPAGKWSTLKLEARGARFRVFLNGEHLFDVEDDTFHEAGKLGLWTKADSVTAFDDFTIEVSDAGR